ncbi:MAG: N-acetylmuramoyl-L-alanine amidase [Flavobacteriales bacterium]|nr:N-acetylmuramoyl-L-alanine amidase [Flavobacteriales bacterium]MCB9191970.1 N-acetylmuramoyl-L-alanine amidase [Flavobacteriales bacterium]MCB9204990.1 N-acetylmuramoyl-L-alanine amidase [Flavobacteriales bacterium]
MAQTSDELYRMKTIVVDAGHGGKDPGNLGTGRYKTKEKDIALDVALRVGSYIKTQFPEINVLYTRETDVFIGLDERAEIANKAKADLFISIHCNAFPNPASNGVETFVLGLHKNQENLQVAMKENSAIFLEDDYKTKYEGFDPNSPESIIALTIMQSAFLQQSLSISAYIQKQFKERVGRRDRGVKQAGFLVLRKTTMPSILVELGFLTHAPEEDFLNSENGKAYMASAIFRGFKEYKELVEDPLPEGYVEPKVEDNIKSTPTKAEEEAKKQEELDAMMNAKAQARLDSIKKADDAARAKAVADSLEAAKQKLLAEKAKREEELKKQEAAKEAALKAKADSLEQVRLQKLEEMKKRQAEIVAQQEKEEAERKAKEEADKKAKEEAAKLAREEEERKLQEAKDMAKQVLEEIKEQKERELAEAKKKEEEAAIEAEKKKLEALKLEKQRQLEAAREKAAQDSLAKARASELADVREKAKQDSIALEESRAKAKEDSLRLAKLREEQLKAQRLKATQDSIAAARRKEAADIEAEIGAEKATDPEEAELLFLQLRKKQLEEKIARLKGKNVTAPTVENLEQRAEEKPQPVNKVSSSKGEGVELKVQVVTSTDPLSSDDRRFLGQTVWEYQQGGLYKYTVGNTADFEEITKLQSELRNLGFSGAFVVAFKDGERIKVSEAREILNKGE